MPVRRKQTLILFALAAVATLVMVSAAGSQPLNAQQSTPAPIYTAGAASYFAAASDVVADPPVNCRYGVTTHETNAFVVSDIGAGIFYKFNVPGWNNDPAEMAGSNAEVARMIQTKQKKNDAGDYLPGYETSVPLDEDLAELIRLNPGTLWLIGNEIERGPDPGKTFTLQGDMYPSAYAWAYHDVYNFIKVHDPTARVAIAGIIQPTPLRLQYLDKVLAAYEDKYGKKMPVDVWNIHLYPLSEVKADGSPNNIASVPVGTTDTTLAKREARSAAECASDDVYCLAEHDDLQLITDHLVAFRQWMKKHGEQQKPLIISEYGVVFAGWVGDDGVCYPADEFGNCFSSERVASFLEESFDYLINMSDPALGFALDGNRLVQQTIWFSAFHNAGAFNSNLLQWRTGSRLSDTGEAYRNHVLAAPTPVNLLVEEVGGRQIAAGQDGTYTAELTVQFRNSGDVAIEKPFWITFYEDSALSKSIGTVRLSELVRGCATQSYGAELEWAGLPAGRHDFWVKLDSQNGIGESGGENDNVGKGSIVVGAAAGQYVLDIQLDGEGGAVSAAPDLPLYPNGTAVELLALPYQGWRFAGWSGDASGSNPATSVTMNSDKSVVARFQEIRYSVSVSVKGEGSVTIEPEQAYYGPGDEVQLTAVAEDGWRFQDWIGDIYSASPRVLLSVEGNTALRARFAEVLPGETDRTYLPLNVHTP